MVKGYILFVDLCCGLEKGRLVVGEIHLLDTAKPDHQHTLVQTRDHLGAEGVGGIHRRYSLEVDMGARELRGDEVDVVIHGAPLLPGGACAPHQTAFRRKRHFPPTTNGAQRTADCQPGTDFT